MNNDPIAEVIFMFFINLPVLLLKTFFEVIVSIPIMYWVLLNLIVVLVVCVYPDIVYSTTITRNIST